MALFDPRVSEDLFYYKGDQRKVSGEGENYDRLLKIQNVVSQEKSEVPW